MKTFYNTFYHRLDGCSMQQSCYDKMISHGKKYKQNDTFNFSYDREKLYEKINNIENPTLKWHLTNIFYKFYDYDLSILEHNLDSLLLKTNFQKIHSVFFSDKVTGLYDTKKNIIYYKGGDNFSLYHELLHSSSTIYPYSGFSNKKTGFGNAFNEGYTQTLSFYLHNISKFNNGYDVEMKVVEMLQVLKDKIFTQEYFNANLNDIYSMFDKNERYLLTDLLSCLDLYSDLVDLNKNNITFKRIIYYLNIINETYLCLLINKYKEGYNKDIKDKLLEYYDLIINEFDGNVLYDKNEYEDFAKLVLKEYKR